MAYDVNIAIDAYLYCTQKRKKGTTYLVKQNTVSPAPQVYVYCKNDKERKLLEVLSTNQGWIEFYYQEVCKGNLKSYRNRDETQVYSVKDFHEQVYLNW